MKKRLFAGALALLMIIGLLPVSSMMKKPIEAKADGDGVYTLDSSTYSSSLAKGKIDDVFTAVNKVKIGTGPDNVTCFRIDTENRTFISITVPEGKSAKIDITWYKSSKTGAGLVLQKDTDSNVKYTSTFDDSKTTYDTYKVENLEAGTYNLQNNGVSFLLRKIAVTLTDNSTEEKPYTVTINDEYADEKTSSDKYAEGAKVELSAKGVKQGKTFLYWKNSNGVIVATGDKDIPVYYSDTYTAVYAKEGAKVEYLTPYGGVLETYYAEDVKNADFKVPQGPTRYGYTFDGWDTDVNADNIDTLLVSGNVTVKPKYKNADSNIKITVDTTDFDSIKRESSNITINTEIKASVSPDNFAYWAEVDDKGTIKKVLSYNSTYYFLANREIIVKAITKDAAGDNNADAKPIITKVDYDTTSKTVIYEYTVPEGYTMNYVGVLASTNKTKLESANVDSDVEGVYKLGANKAECSSYRTFRYTLTITGTDTWYIKPILTYLGTSTGTEYGDVLTIN